MTGVLDGTSLEQGRYDSMPMAATKTRVLFVNTATLPPLGADTWVHAQIMRHIDRSTHELHVACATGRSDAPTPTFQVLSRISDIHRHSVNFGPEFSGRSKRGKFLALLRTLPAIPSLLHLAVFVRRQHVPIIHTSDRPRDAFACVLLGRLTGARCIIHVHVGYGDWMSPLLKWALKRADALITVSEFVRGTLISSGLDGARIRVVLNGIEPTDWIPRTGREDARREFGLAGSAPLVVTVCRLFPSKGPADLIRVLPELRYEHPDIRLMIVGQEMVAGYRDQLEALARELDVAENVIFTGRRSDIPRLMAAADVYAMPSIGEPCALVFLEAMAMELPVVALESGGTPETVEHDTVGLLSEPGDLGRLAEHLSTLLRSPARRASMGARGRERVEAHFTSRRMARDIERVYEWLAS